MILVTCHRRENRGARLRQIAAALKRLARELPVEVVLPLHSNPQLQRTVRQLLQAEPNIALFEPVDHVDLVYLMDRCWLILTDSGGLQEEGPALGKPVLVLRDKTERAEAIATENIELVGANPERIFDAVSRLLHDEARYECMSRPRFPFGRGDAAPKIAQIVEDFLLPRTVVRPRLTSADERAAS